MIIGVVTQCNDVLSKWTVDIIWVTLKTISPRISSFIWWYLTYIKFYFHKSVQKLLPFRWRIAHHRFLNITLTSVIRKDRAKNALQKGNLEISDIIAHIFIDSIGPRILYLENKSSGDYWSSYSINLPLKNSQIEANWLWIQSSGELENCNVLSG